ncbi:hypothetical protein DLJ60_30555, partial [Micromonospora chalcea]
MRTQGSPAARRVRRSRRARRWPRRSRAAGRRVRALHSFLGVPVRIRDHVWGNLYLAEKQGAAEFT